MKSLKALVLLLMVPAVLAGQAHKPKLRGLKAKVVSVNAAADSAGFKWELGSDVNVAQTGDSLLGDLRVAYILNSNFTLEPAFGAKSTAAGLEGEASLGVTAAIFPGATSMHGEALHGALAYHRWPDGSHQFCAIGGTFMRAVATNGIAARVGTGFEHCFAGAGPPRYNSVFVRIGISFWR